MAKIKKIDHTNVVKDVEQTELSHATCDNVESYNHFGKQFGSLLKS